MFKVKIISIGHSKEKWLLLALSEYEKRLQGSMKIEWVLSENEKEFEEKALLEKNYIALDPRGKSLSSEELSRALFTQWGTRPTFLIGGALGLSETVKKNALYQISFSKLTFTHQMMRLILAEQLYRALQIEKNTQYHK